MSGHANYILLAGESSWRLGVVRDGEVETHSIDLSEANDIAQTAQTIRQMLDREGYNGEAILLALPTSWCLCALINTQDTPRRDRQRTLTYRLEERLPLAAEQMVADFHDIDDQSALGVCAILDRVQPWIEALEACGVAIHVVCPEAWLAVQDLIQSHPPCDGLALYAENHVDLFFLEDGKPVQWLRSACDADELRWHLQTRQIASGQGLKLLVVGSYQAYMNTLYGMEGLETEVIENADLAECACRAADRLLNGQAEPMINLRREQLAVTDPHRHIRKPLNAALVAALILLVGAIVFFNLRAVHYQGLAESNKQKQIEVFRQTLPKMRLTHLSPLGRMQSEFNRLRGVRGDSDAVPEQPSALVTLQQVLRGLPRKLRYRILEMRIEPERLLIEGQARSHSDTDTIATALRGPLPLKIEPPQTQRLKEEGVGFIITAAPKESQTDAGGTR